jgi:hypothetical protein
VGTQRNGEGVKILIFGETEKSLRVKDVLGRFLPSDFGSETVFLVLTAGCEISFLALEKDRKTSRTQLQ